MSFADDIASDLKHILAEEFSVRIFFQSKDGLSEHDTSGIYDDTYEEAFNAEGQSVNARITRVTIAAATSYEIQRGDLVRVYGTDGVSYTEFSVLDTQVFNDSLLVNLKR